VQFWNWLTFSDSGLLFRIGVGVAIFAVLAISDLRKNRAAATRWREYSFLVICVLLALVYGLINDALTSSISWEYFYYGKDLAAQLGPQVPPDPMKLHLAAAVIGMKATWSAGLVIGVALLLANNPSRRLPRLRNRSLLRWLLLVLLLTLLFAAAGAIAGHFALPALWNSDFAAMFHRNEMRPRRFMTAYGIHLGSYIGGLLGMLAAAWRIRLQRRPKTQFANAS
jgi:glucan phosphoethanolaminetransferase (alkaline phosphatase superfamily)